MSREEAWLPLTLQYSPCPLFSSFSALPEKIPDEKIPAIAPETRDRILLRPYYVPDIKITEMNKAILSLKEFIIM